MCEDGGVVDDEWVVECVDFWECEGFDDDFGVGVGGIVEGDGEDWERGVG